MVKALAGKPWARKQVACTEDDKKKVVRTALHNASATIAARVCVNESYNERASLAWPVARARAVPAMCVASPFSNRPITFICSFRH